ncbi:MAG: 50S ribosomal protein L24 [Clostridiales Family XIII bacterium]|jgi:large subunit ribosomal protein L24|nr:50S ribosomal protein L24 [Clostridiales Family XIII bacterium]
MKIKKNDTVMVISGKEKGKHGKVLKVYPAKQTVIVEGVNMQTKHQKQTRKVRAEIKHQEGPLHVSNVMYYDTRDKTATRVGYTFEDGVKVRYSKKTGSPID